MIESLRKLEITGKFYIIREIFKKKNPTGNIILIVKT